MSTANVAVHKLLMQGIRIDHNILELSSGMMTGCDHVYLYPLII